MQVQQEAYEEELRNARDTLEGRVREDHDPSQFRLPGSEGGLLRDDVARTDA